MADIPGNTSNRTLCEVFENMRKCYETRNFSYLLGLIEEGQYRAERMENAIEKYGGWNGVRDMEKKRVALRKEIRELKDKRDKLKEAVGEAVPEETD